MPVADAPWRIEETPGKKFIKEISVGLIQSVGTILCAK